MVNVLIYLNQSSNAEEIVFELLKSKLIANASIDIDNINYHLENNEIVKTVNTVITAQTKSLLFSSIESIIHNKFGTDIPVYSLPITQANTSFDLLIRNSTIKS